MLVYVAGPFRGASHWAIAENIRRAERVALAVWEAGWPALCPHANTAHFQEALPDHVWLDGDLMMLEECGAVVLVEGWEQSAGTRAEMVHAATFELPIFTSVERLVAHFGYGPLRQEQERAA